MSQVLLPLDASTGRFPTARPAGAAALSMTDDEWSSLVNDLNAALAQNEMSKFQLGANFCICCSMVLDIPLVTMLIISHFARWYDHLWQNHIFWATLALSVVTIPLVCMMRRDSQLSEVRMRAALQEINMRLWPSMTQVMLVDDPQCVLAARITQGMPQQVLDPLQIGNRRMGAIARPIVIMHSPHGMHGSGATPTVVGMPVQLGHMQGQGGIPMQPPRPPPLTVSIPEACQPGQPFQFVHPQTGQTVEAIAPADGRRLVEVQL